MKVILISGPSATGKSQLAMKYSKQLGYEYIGKDTIKEKIFDREKHNSWDWKWYEKKAKQQFFDEIETALRNNKSVIAESNYIKSDKAWIEKSIAKASDVREVYVTANGIKRVWRFIKRNETGNRHKYHHDRRWYFSEFIDGLAGLFGVELRYHPVGINNNLIRIDTTNFENLNYEKLDHFLAN